MIGRTLRHVVLGLIVFIWVVPFVALVTTSLRSELASQTSGFWTSYSPTELGHRFSTNDKGGTAEVTELTGNIFERLNKDEQSFRFPARSARSCSRAGCRILKSPARPS